jgi:hypothetical protein
MNRHASPIRPQIIAEIARWWQESLRATESLGSVLEPPDAGEVAARFHCTEEEALRGLTAGEQLHFGGGE